MIYLHKSPGIYAENHVIASVLLFARSRRLIDWDKIGIQLTNKGFARKVELL
jgi:hypothetical protein